MLNKEARYKSHKSYNSIYMEYPEWANSQRQRVSQWLTRAGGRDIGNDRY